MITPFDPWKSDMCTCPKKYSFSPYTGCGHRCIYCYITSYIPKAFFPREKRDLIKRFTRELKKISPMSLISISNSSDPYQPMERERRLMRSILPLLKSYRVLIVTKSDLITRDIDLLRNLRSTVSITITTLNRDLASQIEPYAPSPQKRIKALETLVENGIQVSARVDPIIPFINENVDDLIKELADAGVKHITSSTYKLRWDSWKRIYERFPEVGEKIKNLYLRGEKRGNTYYLKRELRIKMLKRIQQITSEYGMTFACCREGLQLNTGICDGSHLIGGRE